MLKLVSINIERDKHFETVIPFLEKEASDVVCLQEVFEKDLPVFEKVLNMKSFFKPMSKYPSSTGEEEVLSVAIFFREKHGCNYSYIFGKEEVPVFTRAKNEFLERHINNIVVLWADISDTQGYVYRIATTHFTLTPKGLSTEYQKEDAIKLIEVLESKAKEFILVGDLNAPRGKETFAMLAQKLKDNIPLEYTSSIDPNLHRVPGLSFMVDGLFSTPKYEIRDVKLVSGVSDHKAIVAILDIKNNE